MSSKTQEEDQVVEPLGSVKEEIALAQAEEKALKLSQELIARKDQEKRRCKHPKHPTYYVNRSGKCRKAWKCPHFGSLGCVATTK